LEPVGLLLDKPSQPPGSGRGLQAGKHRLLVPDILRTCRENHRRGMPFPFLPCQGMAGMNRRVPPFNISRRRRNFGSDSNARGGGLRGDGDRFLGEQFLKNAGLETEGGASVLHRKLEVFLVEDHGEARILLEEFGNRIA